MGGARLPKVTKRLVLNGADGNHVWRTSLNDEAWKSALVTAGVIPEPETKPETKEERYAAAREHGMHALRYFYASARWTGARWPTKSPLSTTCCSATTRPTR